MAGQITTEGETCEVGKGERVRDTGETEVTDKGVGKEEGERTGIGKDVSMGDGVETVEKDGRDKRKEKAEGEKADGEYKVSKGRVGMTTEDGIVKKEGKMEQGEKKERGYRRGEVGVREGELLEMLIEGEEEKRERERAK